MKKIYLIIVLCFIFSFLTSCNVYDKLSESEQGELIKEENNNTNDKISSENEPEKSVNKSPNQANGGKFDFDDERIYYINNNKLYSINKTGEDKKILFDKDDVFYMMLSENKIYLICNSRDRKFYSIDKEGNNLTEINHSFNKWDCRYIIYDDSLFYLREVQDFLYNVVIYDIENENEIVNTKVNEISVSPIKPTIYDEKLYYRDYERTDRLIEYDGKNINYVEFNKVNEHKEKYVDSIQIVDDYIYYNNKHHISRDKLYEAENPEIILLDETYTIATMNVTEEYIFFTNVINYYDQDKVTVQLNRIKHDGSDLKTIFEDKINFSTNLSASSIYVIDNLIFYELRETGEIKIIDLDGNNIDWNM